MPVLLNNASYNFMLNGTKHNAYINGHAVFGSSVSTDYTRNTNIDLMWDSSTNTYKRLITLTVVPTPSDATVTLSATGYTTVSGTGEQSIVVIDNTPVTVTIEKLDWTTYTHTVNVVIDDSTYGNHMWGYVSLYKALRLLATFTASTEDVMTYQMNGSLYNYVRVVIAGAAGQQMVGSGQSDPIWNGTPGRGAVLQISSYFTGSPTLQFILGKQPVKNVGDSYKGGWGYYSGGTAGYVINPSGFTGYMYGGGGGGSSAVMFDQIYQACGGGGCGNYDTSWISVQGANGGGSYGGQATPIDGSVTGVINGYDATDPDLIGYNEGTGFIQIYGAYYPD